MHFLAVRPIPTPPEKPLLFRVLDTREQPVEEGAEGLVVLDRASSTQVLEFLGKAAAEREVDGRRKVLAGYLAEHETARLKLKRAAPVKA